MFAAQAWSQSNLGQIALLLLGVLLVAAGAYFMVRRGRQTT